MSTCLTRLKLVQTLDSKTRRLPSDACAKNGAAKPGTMTAVAAQMTDAQIEGCRRVSVDAFALIGYQNGNEPVSIQSPLSPMIIVRRLFNSQGRAETGRDQI